MGELQDRDVYEQLVDVIVWEMNAQVGVRRPLYEMPKHIADTILDFFDVRPKPGAGKVQADLEELRQYRLLPEAGGPHP